MRIAIDTNRYSDLARGVADVVALVSTATEVAIPFAVLAELSVGFRRGNRQAENERLLTVFRSKPGVYVLYPDERTVQLFAEISTGLLQRGTPIPINDIWIAAIAMQHGLMLFARDKHFDLIPGLLRT
jgi:predicted nucleic acid-binding protein